MNDLAQRYLAAVERRLPAGDASAKAKAKDIIAELSEVLTSQIEAKEGELGRVATADEIAYVLKAFGHPVVVASRYSGNDHLIGPEYYPWFWHVQRIAVGAALLIGFGVATVSGLGSDAPMQAAIRGMWSALQIALVVFAVVTGLFIAAERGELDLKWTGRWNPKHLAQDNIRQPKTLFDTAFALAGDIFFLLWWTKMVSFPSEIAAADGRSVSLAFSPAWDAVYWPILALVVASAVVHAADLIHPAWSRARAVVSIVGHVAGLAILGVLFNSRPLVEAIAVNGTDVDQTDRIFRTIDMTMLVSLGVLAAIWLVSIGLELRRLWRTRGGSQNGSRGSQQVVI